MDKLNTKQILLEVSEKIFAESGFEGASTRRITVEAGVNISTIKYHYGSKELLYIAVFNYRIAELNQFCAGRLKKNAAKPVQKLNAFIDEYSRMLKSNYYFLKLLNRELCSPDKSSLKKYIVSELSANSRLLYKVIEQGIQSKTFRQVNLPLVVLTIFTLLFQIVVSSPVSESILQYEKFDISWEERITDLKQYLLAILKV